MFHCHLSLYKNRLKLDPRKAQTHEKDMAIWGLNYMYVWEQVILLRCLRTRNSLIKANSVLKGKLELWWRERFWIFTKTPWAALKITIKEHIILVKKKKKIKKKISHSPPPPQLDYHPLSFPQKNIQSTLEKEPSVWTSEMHCYYI